MPDYLSDSSMLHDIVVMHMVNNVGIELFKVQFK